jgi:hypothetical protein
VHVTLSPSGAHEISCNVPLHSATHVHGAPHDSLVQPAFVQTSQFAYASTQADALHWPENASQSR